MGGSRAAMGFRLATFFTGSRTRKRFLKQTTALYHMLRSHGFDIFFDGEGDPTIMGVEKGDQVMLIGIQEGERRFLDTDPIFCIQNGVQGTATEKVWASNLRCAAGLLVKWGMLAEGEVTEDEISEAAAGGRICCSGCLAQQPARGPRFKQCGLCNARERKQRLPSFRGFYCGPVCQRSDWAAHRLSCH